MKKFEFWFRKEYEQLIRQRSLTQFVRPGVRLSPEPKGTHVGASVLVRFLDKPGTQNSEPVLNPYSVEAVVTKLEVKKIEEMNAKDFEGATPDAASSEGVINQLERIYERPFSLEDTVTVFKIVYQ